MRMAPAVHHRIIISGTIAVITSGLVTRAKAEITTLLKDPMIMIIHMIRAPPMEKDAGNKCCS